MIYGPIVLHIHTYTTVFVWDPEFVCLVGAGGLFTFSFKINKITQRQVLTFLQAFLNCNFLLLIGRHTNTDISAIILDDVSAQPICESSSRFYPESINSSLGLLPYPIPLIGNCGLN